MKEQRYYFMNIIKHRVDKSINGDKSETESATHVSSTDLELFLFLSSFRIYLVQNIK